MLRLLNNKKKASYEIFQLIFLISVASITLIILDIFRINKCNLQKTLNTNKSSNISSNLFFNILNLYIRFFGSFWFILAPISRLKTLKLWRYTVNINEKKKSFINKKREWV